MAVHPPGVHGQFLGLKTRIPSRGGEVASPPPPVKRSTGTILDVFMVAGGVTHSDLRRVLGGGAPLGPATRRAENRSVEILRVRSSRLRGSSK